MKPAISITMTYDKTTPESAEHGETSDHGFYSSGGYFQSLPELKNLRQSDQKEYQRKLAELASDATTEFESIDLESAIDFILSYGAMESDSYPQEGEQRYTQADADIDYTTGEQTRLTLHVEGEPAMVQQVHKALKEKGYLL
jgi:hypothetical protein